MKKRKERVKAVCFAMETAPSSRHYLVTKFAGIHDEKMVIVAENAHLHYMKFNLWHVHQLCKWFFVWELAWLGAVFKPKVYDASWTLNTFNDGIQAILMSGNNCDFYFFVSLSNISYLSNYYLSEIIKEKCFMISSNSPMYRPMRYTWLPSAGLKICSSFLVEEYRAYSEIGWMKFKEMEVWGLEESDQLDAIVDRASTFDLAIYSSAEWARNRFYWREKDITKLRNYENAKLFIYDFFDKVVLDTVIELKKKRKMDVVFFPHPYERYLQEKYDIKPPYLEKLKENGILYDNSGKNSVEKIFMARVAVAECSTIIFDRWHLHLPAYTFSGVGREKEFQVDYSYRFLGSFEKYCYVDANELMFKLETHF